MNIWADRGESGRQTDRQKGGWMNRREDGQTGGNNDMGEKRK